MPLATAFSRGASRGGLRAFAFKVLTGILAGPAGLAWSDPLPSRLDEIRIPGGSFSATVEIRHSPKPAAPPETSVFQSLTHEAADGSISTLLLCTLPAKDAGKRVLLRGDGCWFYDPRAKRPTRISSGQIWSQPMASDSPNWRLARDFAVSAAGKESVVCADGRERGCTVLDFTPKDSSLAAPARLRYWADETGRYWRVQHFARSGQVLKTIEVTRYADVLGVPRAVALRIAAGPETAEVVVKDFQRITPPVDWFEPQRFYRVKP